MCKDPYDLAILKGVSERYEVIRSFNLDQKVIRMLSGLDGEPAFDGLVTHLPRSGLTGASYGLGLDILWNIRAAFENPIIVYTGAPLLPRQVAWTIADEVVDKSTDAKRNLDAIVTALESAWLRLEKGEPVAPPDLISSNGWTVVELELRLVLGLLIQPACTIHKLCKTFQGRVIIEKMLEGRPEASASGSAMTPTPLDLMVMEASIGTPLRVSVEGDGEEARLLAKQLYSILTASYPCQVDVMRFV